MPHVGNLARLGREHIVSYAAFQNTLDEILPFVMPQTEATFWNLANASGESMNIDYAARADIARVYSQQQIFSRIGDKLADDFRSQDFTRNGIFS
jgi:hypothetical protein